MEIAVENDIDNSDTLGIIPFYFGRIDCDTSPLTNEGNAIYPNPDRGWTETAKWFNDHFNFTEIEAVAIMGAHSLGRAHINYTGYQNSWLSITNTLSHVYYEQIIANGWVQEQVPLSSKYQWYSEDENKNIEYNTLSMNCDISLFIDINEYLNTTTGQVLCSHPNSENSEYIPCNSQSSTENIILNYRDNNQMFLNHFNIAWNKMITNGYDIINDNLTVIIP